MRGLKCILSDPGFSEIISLEYYDGPEVGLAVYPTGRAMKFYVVGESHFQILRAFIFIDVSGNWSDDVFNQRKECEVTDRRIIVPKYGSKNIMKIVNNLSKVDELRYYVAISDRSFECMAMTSIDSENVYDIRSSEGQYGPFALSRKIILSSVS